MHIVSKTGPIITLTSRLSCNSNIRRYTSVVQVLKNRSNSSNSLQRNYASRIFNATNRSEFNQENNVSKKTCLDRNILNSNSSKVLLKSVNWQHADEHNMESSIASKLLQPKKQKKENQNFNRSQLANGENVLLINKEFFNYLAADVHKNWQHDILFGESLKSLKPFTGCSWNPFKLNKNSCLTNTSLSKKSYSTKSTNFSQQKSLLESQSKNSDNFNILPKTSSQKVITLTTRRPASSSKLQSKCNPNYDYPFLFKLFGTKELLMRCDAYNQALVEAAKRRAVLAECAKLNDKLENNPNGRPKVINIKGCNAPSLIIQNALEPASKESNSCPPPQKLKKQASNGCKKDDPCKPTECPNPCKDEIEKLRYKNEIENKKKDKMPTECESPKCRKEDNCTKLRKSPCKKASKSHSIPNLDQQKVQQSSSPCPLTSKPKQASDGCKRDDPCKPPECPNPCKDEMEKIKRIKDEEIKKNKNKMPTGCISPKCRKEDPCTKRIQNPCKKANDSSKGPIGSKEPIKCNKKDGSSGSDDKPQERKQKNPCSDEHNEYKPKCNDDPCKQNKSPCGGVKKTPDGLSATKKADSCGSGKNEDSYKKDKKKDNPCNKQDKKKSPCGDRKQKQDPCKKKDSDPCGKKKEDPCKKTKEEPCKNEKQPTSPCSKKQTVDPCKKEKDSGCDSKQNKDSCRKKEDSCKKQKEDPCKKKKQPSSPCVSKKEDPCKKDKDDPCKKKKNSPCVTDNKKDNLCSKKPTSPCKSKTDSKKQSCGKLKKETKPNCGQNKNCFSTLATMSNNSLIKRTFANLTTVPLFKNKNFYNFGFMRHYSSNKKKGSEDLGKSSQCKAIVTNVPAQRKPAYNPHPREGLRKCYPTYDMDCKKLCKDARKTDCKKYAFLKDTDNNKRSGNK